MVQVAQFLEGSLILGLFAVVLVGGLALVAAVVYLEHRKEMALIEAGEVPEPSDSRAWILAGGLLALAVGLGQFVEGALSTGTVGDGAGLTLALVGVAALSYYYLKRREGRGDRGNRENRDGPSVDDSGIRG